MSLIIYNQFDEVMSSINYLFTEYFLIKKYKELLAKLLGINEKSIIYILLRRFLENDIPSCS